MLHYYSIPAWLRYKLFWFVFVCRYRQFLPQRDFNGGGYGGMMIRRTIGRFRGANGACRPPLSEIEAGAKLES
jgi:hypothetical protein